MRRALRTLGWTALGVGGACVAAHLLWLMAPMPGHELPDVVGRISGFLLGILYLSWPGLLVIGLIAVDAWMRKGRS